MADFDRPDNILGGETEEAPPDIMDFPEIPVGEDNTPRAGQLRTRKDRVV